MLARVPSPARPARLPALVSALITVLAAILFGTAASATAAVEAGTRVGAFNVTGQVLVEPPQHVSPGQHPGRAGDSVETTLATGVAANGAARALPSSSEAAALIRGAKPTGSALKSDAWHRAASFAVDDIAENGPVFRTVGGDGVERLLVQMSGEVNGIAGGFEWIVDGGSLTHQMFVRGGSINGIPIRP